MARKSGKKKKSSGSKDHKRIEKSEIEQITPEEATNQLFHAVVVDDQKLFDKALSSGANFYNESGVSIVESIVDVRFVIPKLKSVLGFSGRVGQLEKKSSDYQRFMEQRGALGGDSYRLGISLEDNSNEYLKKLISQRPEEYEGFAKTKGFQKVLDRAIDQSSGQILNTLISANRKEDETSLEILPPNQHLVSKTFGRLSKEVKEVKDFKDSIDEDILKLQAQGAIKRQREAAELSDNFFESRVAKEKMRKALPFFKVAELLINNAGQEVLGDETERGISILKKEITTEIGGKLSSNMTAIERAVKARKEELKDIETRPTVQQADENMLRMIDDEREEKLTKRYKTLSRSLKEDDIEYIRESKVVERVSKSEDFSSSTKRGAYINLLDKVVGEIEKVRDTHKTLKVLESANNNEEIYAESDEEKAETPRTTPKQPKYNKKSVINNNNNFLDWFKDRDDNIKQKVEESLKAEEVYISKDQNIDSYVEQIRDLSAAGNDVSPVVQAINTAYEAADGESEKSETKKRGKNSKKEEKKKNDFLSDTKPKLNNASASDRAFSKAFNQKLEINTQIGGIAQKLEELMSGENIANKNEYIQKLRKSFDQSSASFKKLETTYGKYHLKASELLEGRTKDIKSMEKTKGESKDKFRQLAEEEAENPSEQKGIIVSKRQKEINELKSSIDKLNKQIVADKKKLKGTRFHTEKWSTERLEETKESIEQIGDDLQLVEEISAAQTIDKVEKGYQTNVRSQIRGIKEQKEQADNQADKFRRMVSDSKRDKTGVKQSLEKIQNLIQKHPSIASQNFEMMERLEKSGGKFEQSNLSNTEKVLLGDFMADHKYQKPPEILGSVLESFPRVAENMESNLQQFLGNLPNLDAINQGFQIGFVAGMAMSPTFAMQQQSRGMSIRVESGAEEVLEADATSFNNNHTKYFNPKSKKAGKEGINSFEQTSLLDKQLASMEKSLKILKKGIKRQNTEQLKEELEPLRGGLESIDENIGKLPFDMDKRTQKRWSKAVVDFNALNRLNNARLDKIESKSSTEIVMQEKEQEEKQLQEKQKAARVEQLKYYETDRENQENQEKIRSLSKKFPAVRSTDIQLLQMLESSGGRFDFGDFTGLGVVVLGDVLSKGEDEKGARELNDVLESFPMVKQNLSGSIAYYEDRVHAINCTPMFPAQEKSRQHI